MRCAEVARMRRPETRESVRGLAFLEYLQNAKMADSKDFASGTVADPIINGYADLLKHLARALLAASLFALRSSKQLMRTRCTRTLEMTSTVG
jgi:hypothetical protein